MSDLHRLNNIHTYLKYDPRSKVPLPERYTARFVRRVLARNVDSDAKVVASSYVVSKFLNFRLTYL